MVCLQHGFKSLVGESTVCIILFFFFNVYPAVHVLAALQTNVGSQEKERELHLFLYICLYTFFF